MNKTILLGRLTRDPELRHTQSGTAVASFILAVDRPVAKGAEKRADFIDCIAWRGTGELVAKHFAKGQMCAVSGRLQIRDWTDKDGNKRRSAEVVADNVHFTESKRSRDAGRDGDTYDVPVSGSDFAELDEDDGGILPF